MLIEVGSQTAKYLWIVFGLAQDVVATVAEESSDFSRRMIMVDVESDSFLWRG